MLRPPVAASWVRQRGWQQGAGGVAADAFSPPDLAWLARAGANVGLGATEVAARISQCEALSYFSGNLFRCNIMARTFYLFIEKIRIQNLSFTF